MSHELSLKQIKKEYHGTYTAYFIGFFGSLFLTFISFSLVAFNVISGNAIIWTLVGLAFVQAILQLLFFLHVGKEAKPKWETLIFGFMVLILLIVIIGTLWIMYDLNIRVMEDMSPKEMVHD